MSFVHASTDLIGNAATDLAGIRSALSAANAAAAGPTAQIQAAGADEISAAIATLFGSHAHAYQAFSAQATAFHDQFVQTLEGAGNAYAAEAANASPLQSVLDAINAPTQTLLGRPLIGDGANGGPGQAGGDGGLLYQNP
jgi:hypothetical protein